MPGAELPTPRSEGSIDIVQLEGPLDRITAGFLFDRLDAAARDRVQLVIVTVNSAAALRVDFNVVTARLRSGPVPVAVWSQAGGPVRDALAGGADFAATDDEIPAVGGVVAAVNGRTFRGRVMATTRAVTGPAGEPRNEPAVPIRFLKPPFLDRILHAVASPHIISFLFLAGLTAIAFEVYTAGIGLAALTGALCLWLAFAGMTAGPYRYWAAAVMTVGLLGFAVDAQTTRVTVRAAIGSGLVAVGLAACTAGGPPGYRMTVWVGALTLGLTTFFWMVALPVMIRTRYATARVERDPLVGERGVARSPTEVEVRDARWPARAREGAAIGAGAAVSVVSVDGEVLVVAGVDDG